MLLEQVRVLHYKCILDSGVFTIAPVTCLVGKNESGKSALLQALYKLNPVRRQDRHYNAPDEYPRHHYREYKERVDQPGAKADAVVATRWELSDEDCIAVEDVLGPGCLRSTLISCFKHYDDAVSLSVDVDEAQCVRNLVAQAQLSASEKASLRQIKTLLRLRDSLTRLASPSEQQTALLTKIDEVYPNGRVISAAVRILYARMPKFVYFADYYKLPGKVPLDAVLEKTERGADLSLEESMFLALLGLAKTSLDVLRRSVSLEEYIRTLELASERITEEILPYWSQSRHLSVQFRIDSASPKDPPPLNHGRVFHTRIYDARHKASFNFDDRSTGFIWFFSFLVWMSQVRSMFGDNVVVLLDEPGLSLHGRAQGDLLRYIHDKLNPQFQVIYTTHSPFMIDASNLLDTRTVRDVTADDGSVLGTRVEDKVFSTDKDTVFPLQAALGYDVTQSLFIGGHVLLVEGPSDVLYLQWASQELQLQGRPYLDSRWTLCPVGGLDKMRSFVALFGGNRLDVTVIVDFHAGDKNKLRELRDSSLLKKSHLLTLDTYADMAEADIEEMLGRAIYVPLVNACYALDDDLRIPVMPQEGEIRRLVVEATEHFRTMPANVEEFDHYSPANYLVQHGKIAQKDPEAYERALSRFERLFVDVNSLL